MRVFCYCLFGVCAIWARGIEYREEAVTPFTKVHILVINPDEVEIRSVRAAEGGQSVESLSKEHNAKAAINGGFWNDARKPIGILKSGGVWHRLPKKKRVAIGWNEDNEAVIDRLLTTKEGEEVVVLPQFDHSSPEDWDRCAHIVGGAGFLVCDGKVIHDQEQENITIKTFITRKHCRTSIGILEDGRWVVVVVSGPLKYISGFTLPQLAAYMKQLGCIDAMNLDGGSSARLYYDGSIKNSNRKPRKVSDIIIFFEK